MDSKERILPNMQNRELALRRISKNNIHIYNYENDFLISKTSKTGHGAFGLVVPAIIIKTKQKVALKLYTQYSFDNGISDDIIKEIILLQHLNQFPSTKTVQFYGIAITNDSKSLYLVLELLDDDLGSIVKTKNFSNTEIREIFWKILNAIYSIHSAGVIHNDIKLLNIMLKDNDIRFIDFGFAEFLGISPLEELVKEYRCTEVSKAPDSSEQIAYGFKPKNRKSYASDMYSVGATMIQFITKKYEKLLISGKYIKNGIFDPSDNSFLELGDITTKLKNSDALGESGYNLLLKIMRPNVHRRWCAKRALTHPYFSIDYSGGGFENHISYTLREYEKRQMELCYLEELHQTYLDDTFIFIKISHKFKDIYSDCLNRFVKESIESSIGVDTIINSLILTNKNSKLIFRNIGLDKNHFNRILKIHSKIYQDVFNSPSIVEPKLNLDILIKNQADFQITPIMIHIGYIILHLQYELKIQHENIQPVINDIFNRICQNTIRLFMITDPSTIIPITIWEITIYASIQTIAPILGISTKKLNKNPILPFLTLDNETFNNLNSIKL